MDVQQAWVDRARKGDMAWFDELVEQYQHRVYAMAYRFTHGAAEAEDLAQEIFLLIYQRFGTFEGLSALSTWIYRLCLNRCIGWTRSRQGSWQRRTQGLPETPLPGATLDTEHDALRSRQQDSLHAAVNRLPRSYREVIELYYYEDLPQAQIAQILQIAPRTVETRLYRARDKLKPLLREQGILVKEDVLYG